MSKRLKELLEEISQKHFPNPPASAEEIEAFEQSVGWRLDPELRAFYLHCNGADLFQPPPDTPFRFRPLSRIVRARVAIFDEDDDRYGPASMYTLCYLQDGDYVLVDSSRQENGCYPLIDGWHEGFPDPRYCPKIADSLSDFLEEALRSGGRQFWLKRKAGS